MTARENLLRGETFQARNARKTHCKYGHEFTPENTYVVPTGGRNCRTCAREKRRRLYGYTGLGDPWAQNAAKTHCIRGHEFTPENTYRTREGFRQCRKCNAAKQMAYKQRKRERDQVMNAER